LVTEAWAGCTTSAFKHWTFDVNSYSNNHSFLHYCLAKETGMNIQDGTGQNIKTLETAVYITRFTCLIYFKRHTAVILFQSLSSNPKPEL